MTFPEGVSVRGGLAMTQEAEALFHATPAEAGVQVPGFPLKAGMTFLEGVSVRGGLAMT